MLESRINRKQQLQIFGIILIYLLVTCVHIFYLPQITSSNTSAYNSIYKRKSEKIQALNLVERTDKATFKEATKKAVFATPLIYLDLLFNQVSIKTRQLNCGFKTALAFFNQRYSYLSLCVFRL